jgi:hypothetical protein
VSRLHVDRAMKGDMAEIGCLPANGPLANTRSVASIPARNLHISLSDSVVLFYQHHLK